MNIKLIAAVSVVTIAAVFVVFPPLRGPVRGARQTVNDKLNAEFVIENLEHDRSELRKKSCEIARQIEKINASVRLNTAKAARVSAEADAAKKRLIEAGTSDMRRFGMLKTVYETKKREADSLAKAAADAKKLQLSLESLKCETDKKYAETSAMCATAAHRKAFADLAESSMSLANSASGGDVDLTVALDKLNERAETAEIRIEAAGMSDPVASPAEAQAYLDSLR